jgi:hypothetical protein
MKQLGFGLVLGRSRDNKGEEEQNSMHVVRVCMTDELAEEDGVGVLVAWLYGRGRIDSCGDEDNHARRHAEESLFHLGYPVAKEKGAEAYTSHDNEDDDEDNSVDEEEEDD